MILGSILVDEFRVVGLEVNQFGFPGPSLYA